VIKDLLRKVIPRQLPASLKNDKTLSVEFGQFKTMSQKKCVNSNGDAIPWYTYPALEYIKQLDLSDKTIFEYGSGYSTLFWATRCKKVVSIEHDEKWYELIKPQLPDNVDYQLQVTQDGYVNSIHQTEDSYDVIIDDGAFRNECALAAVQKLHPNGFIILDNSDWMSKASQVLREANLIEVDMSGFGPINSYTWTTSFYFSRQVQLKPAHSVQPNPGIGSSPQGG